MNSLLLGLSTGNVLVLGLLFLCAVVYAVWSTLLSALNPTHEFEYELGAIAVMANESRYIKEWLEWHRRQGIDHFFIYDNDSVENDYAELFGESLLPYVTVKRWSGVKAKGILNRLSSQRQAYNHAMQNYAGKCQRALVCDIDEFAMPAPGSTHSRVIDALPELPENAAWIEITRRDFGHRPHEKRPRGGVVDSYVWRSATLPKHYRKSIVNGAVARYLSWSRGVHCPRWRLWLGCRARRPWMRYVDEERHLRINHYFTKSAEEWTERGRFWDGNRFNRPNGRRAVSIVEPPPEFSEVEDHHARRLLRELGISRTKDE